MTDKAKELSRAFIAKWDLENPIDFCWRRHFNIPFGSREHLEADFIDQTIWYEEELLLKDIQDNPDAKIDKDGRVILEVGTGDGWGMTQNEVDKAFEELDIGNENVPQ